MYWVKGSVSLLTAAAIVFGSFTLRVRAFDEEEDQTREQGCTFRADPSELLQAQSRARVDVFERASKLNRLSSHKSAVPTRSLASSSASAFHQRREAPTRSSSGAFTSTSLGESRHPATFAVSSKVSARISVKN
jgi:hypothetical protein